MSDYVKRFIEQNIHALENEDWEAFWHQWYLQGDDYWLTDMIEDLESAGIAIDEKSKDARIRYIERVLDKMFQLLMIESNRISRTRVLDELNSHIGLSDEEIISVAKIVAFKHKLKEAPAGWYVR